MIRDVLDGALDLLLGGRCVGCAHPGRALCARCTALLPEVGRSAWPTPVPPGLATPWAADEYAAVVRAMVLAHKERRVLALGAPLGRLLAVAVAESGTADPLVLVPVPSRPSSVRSRGHDPTAALVAHAARLLRGAGRDAVDLSLLRTRPGLRDQAGLDAGERSENLAGSLHCPTAALRRLAARRPHARVIVCDDVITTGVTAREAQRALESVGLPVAAIAAVAATRRRSRPVSGPPTLSWSPPTV